jgi:fused signal recognition particle receptor
MTGLLKGAYMGFFDKIKAGLAKTRALFSSALEEVFDNAEKIDDEFYDELEETLILADLGMDTVNKLMEELRYRVRNRGLTTTEHVKFNLKLILNEMLEQGNPQLDLSTKPAVILVIGVNGVGKTTTIGKIATQLVRDGKKVTLVAGDTFRAAAADQLEVWAGRSGADIVRQHEGADPASVVFDGIQAAKARKSDVIIIDTAGRLHNKQNLMNELNKITRIVTRELPDAAKEVLLVLDGTTGQNGLIQAKQFKEIAGVTAMAVTKLDGTAKGGIVIAVSSALQIPVKFIGVGEQADDLLPFVARDFVDALL